MKILFLLFLFTFICSFTGLFCSENQDVSNYNIESDTTNFSFSLPDNFENNLDLFKSKYNTDDPDYKKMIGAYALGGIGIGIAALCVISILVFIMVGIKTQIIGAILSTLAVVVAGTTFVIGVPFILIGFLLAKFYKKRHMNQNRLLMNKFENNNPEFAFSIPL